MTPQQSSAVIRLGLTEFGEAWDLQRRLVEARQRGDGPDVLLLLQHPHTYTMGRRAVPEHLLLDEDQRALSGVALYEIDRGGDVTYHGPGQVVGYPILSIRERGLDVHAYLRRIEEALIGALARWGIQSSRDPNYTGVWVGDSKIAAIGIKISRGVTSHGFALNVNTDLSYFAGIVPCGIPDRDVTSIQRETGKLVDLDRVVESVIEGWRECFGGRWEAATLEDLLQTAGF